MIVFLLLVIVCILLFGGTAVLGAAGTIIGLLASLYIGIVLLQAPAWAWLIVAAIVAAPALLFYYRIRKSRQAQAAFYQVKAEAEQFERTAQRTAKAAQDDERLARLESTLSNTRAMRNRRS